MPLHWLMDNASEDGSKIFECFFIASNRVGAEPENGYIFPPDYSSDKELVQYQRFCFPFKSQASTGQRHQHFTFMLTDLEKRHKYGFCKLTDGGKVCYCFISVLPWFEIFYKFLNCMCAVYTRDDVNTLHSLLDTLYTDPIPKPKEVVNVSTSLTFCAPDESGLPSIPENRNMMEYYSAFNAKTMIEVFASLMCERRVIFTSSSLSILTGCIYAAESLLYPLRWQHIFIPVLTHHIIDYCSAPMPFLIGVHSSLFESIRDSTLADGVVIVNIDTKEVENPYGDSEDMPSDALSFLKSQLGKPNVAVGSHLAEAFLKTQARLIGGYRSALKFRMGESIVFDEEKFIEMHKEGKRRTFAEGLVQLQTFRQFVDMRMDLLNNGIGFRDAFENEVTELQRQDGEAQNTMYKEWLAVSKKGGEIIYNVKKRAKSNMKSVRESARQGMKDMKNAMKSTEEENRPRPTLRSRQSLRESIQTLRPPRPPPPRSGGGNSPDGLKPPPPPSRPPPPKPPRSSVRRYKVIDDDLDESDEIAEDTTGERQDADGRISLLDEINADLSGDSKDVPLLIDLNLTSGMSPDDDSSPNEFLDLGPVASNSEGLGGPFSNSSTEIVAEDRQRSPAQPRKASIRRAERVRVRPQRPTRPPPPPPPKNNNSNMSDLLGIDFGQFNQTGPQSTAGNFVSNQTAQPNTWAMFEDNFISQNAPTSQATPGLDANLPKMQPNGNATASAVDGPLISFD